MTYERINFVDQSVERPRTYEMTHNADGSVTLVDSFGLVDELGTPINADTMNHIEDGIAATAIRKYNSSETFTLGDWVLGEVENEKNIYKSLQDNNVGNNLADKNYWEVVELGGGGGHDLFDIVQKDHILTYEEIQGFELLGNYVYKEALAGSRYGYPDFYNKCLEEKEASTATDVTLGENTITMYINANGHQFFDIADKEAVDAFYDATGTAWFYGVDTANERILLPRYDYVELSVKDSVPVIGNGIALGLMSQDETYGLTQINSSELVVGILEARIDAYGEDLNSDTITGIQRSNRILGITTDPANSGIETDLSTYSSKKYYYMVVGNTSVESAITDVIDVTTSENDTIPLFHNFWSKEDMTTTGCYVNASLGSWLSGNVYTTAYNTLVGKLGTGNIKSVSDAYTDYDFVVNADDMTFRLPLKNGQEIMFATAVKGNGLALAMTDGTNTGGASSVGYASGVSNGGEIRFGTVSLGKEIGTAVSIVGSDEVFTDNVAVGITTDSSKSGIVLDTENITIPDGWNLYYKVANAVQNLELLDVANVTADLNTKISKAECPRYVVEVSDKSLLPAWYTVYSDGWCEQGGDAKVTEVVFLKPFKDTNYQIFKNVYTNSTNAISGANQNFYERTATSAKCGASITFSWHAMGYIS